jgi:hypothetical protein
MLLISSFVTPYHHPSPAKDMPPFNKSKTLTLSLKHTCFYLAFGAPFAFGEADFHKTKGREALGSHDDFNKLTIKQD